MWLLSDEEKAKINRRVIWEPTCGIGAYVGAVQNGTAQAQLRKVVEEGEKPCPHSTYAGHAGKNPLKRHECPECWAELKKEAGL